MYNGNMTGGAARGVEPARKLIHLLSSLIPLGYLWLSLTRRDALALLAILASPFLAAEILRPYVPSLNRAFSACFGWAMRGTEQGRRTGAFYAVIGALCTILLFDKPVACAALLILAFGDTAASVVGRVVAGPRLVGEKTLSGSLAMFATGSLVALPFFPPALAIGGTLAATIVELLPLPVDDNLSVPLAAGLTLTLLRPLAL